MGREGGRREDIWEMGNRGREMEEMTRIRGDRGWREAVGVCGKSCLLKSSMYDMVECGGCDLYYHSFSI